MMEVLRTVAGVELTQRAYDAAIAEWFATAEGERFPARLPESCPQELELLVLDCLEPAPSA